MLLPGSICVDEAGNIDQPDEKKDNSADNSSLDNLARAQSVASAARSYASAITKPSPNVQHTTIPKSNTAVSHSTRNNVEIWDTDRNITRLPPACELWIEIVTNNATGKRVEAVVWMPEDWNRRLLAFGQGGIGLVGEDAPAITSMAFDGVQQGYATYGLRPEPWRDIKGMRGDTLANGIKKDDIIIDAAWRGLHVTTEFMKRFVKTYYRRPHSKSYFSGCGAGGRQGIKAMSTFPEDYDGLVLGAPANPLARLIPWKISQHHGVYSGAPRHSPTSSRLATPLHASICLLIVRT